MPKRRSSYERHKARTGMEGTTLKRQPSIQDGSCLPGNSLLPSVHSVNLIQSALLLCKEPECQRELLPLKSNGEKTLFSIVWGHEVPNFVSPISGKLFYQRLWHLQKWEEIHTHHSITNAIVFLYTFKINQYKLIGPWDLWLAEKWTPTYVHILIPRNANMMSYPRVPW